jgi:transcriptional regulator of arginine metabolism
MQKTNRLLAIEKIISEENVANQEDIIRSLKSKGISCTQATLSRNLRQLGVGRIADGNGGYRYMLQEGLPKAAVQNPKLNLVPVIVDIIEAKGLMILKTLPGNASNTALFIDGSGRYEIAGTIAGDDTILIIPRDGITLQQVHDCLELILPGIHEQIKRKI